MVVSELQHLASDPDLTGRTNSPRRDVAGFRPWRLPCRGGVCGVTSGVTGCTELFANVEVDERTEVQRRWVFTDADGLIGKLQLLDILKQVCAVGENAAAAESHAAHSRSSHAVIAVVNRDETIAVHVKCFSDDSATAIRPARNPTFNVVLGIVAPIDRRVGVHTKASDHRAVVLDLTHDAHFAWIQGSIQHQRGERTAAECRTGENRVAIHVGVEDFSGILRACLGRVRVHRFGRIGYTVMHNPDPHIQQCVTVDQVVTSSSLHDVIAVATQQDVPVAEIGAIEEWVDSHDSNASRINRENIDLRRKCCPGASEPCVKSGDPGDAFLGQLVVQKVSRVDIWHC